MAVGVVAFSSTEANAQWRNQNNRQERWDDRNDRNRNELYRIARNNGFQDGQQLGRQDRRDRNRDNAMKSREYRQGTNGYYARLGNKDAYRNAYRQAFMEGYNAAYNRNGRDRY